jgi:hypothetical protein
VAALRGKSTVSVLGEFEKRSDLIDPIPSIFEGVDHDHLASSHIDSEEPLLHER